MFKKREKVKSIIPTYIAFSFALIVVVLNIIPLIFPAFLVTLFVGTESNVNSFEVGFLAIPFFIFNLSILVFGLLYYKKIFPNQIHSFFDSILKFEISRKVAIIGFSVIISIYVIFTIGELRLQEIDNWKDWKFLEPIIDEFPFGGDEKPALKIQYIKNFLLFSSQEVFHNVKVVPFIGSISLIFLTYLFTVQITKKKFAGLIALAILLQSNTFLRYDTTATYSNFWTSFYLFSLYLIYKKWSLSPLAYMSSIFSKALTVIYLPMTLFFIFRANIAKKTKIALTIIYMMIFGGILGLIIFAEQLGYGKSLTSFEYDDFVYGFTAMSFQLRIDEIVLLFLLPLTVGLFIKSLQGLREADSILVLIGGILLTAPLLTGFTDFNIQPYRWIPLIVFFAVGIGFLFSKISFSKSIE